MRDLAPRSASSSVSRPSKGYRTPRRAPEGPRIERRLAPSLPMRIRSEAAMLAAFERAQNVMSSGRLVGIVAERMARAVPPGRP